MYNDIIKIIDSYEKKNDFNKLFFLYNLLITSNVDTVLINLQHFKP